jgi:hypothetical protein
MRGVEQTPHIITDAVFCLAVCRRGQVEIKTGRLSLKTCGASSS